MFKIRRIEFSSEGRFYKITPPSSNLANEFINEQSSCATLMFSKSRYVAILLMYVLRNVRISLK